METGYAVVIGLDVGKNGHHACALDPARKKLFDPRYLFHDAGVREDEGVGNQPAPA